MMKEAVDTERLSPCVILLTLIYILYNLSEYN